MSIERSIEVAEDITAIYQRATYDEPEDVLADLLADLIHWANKTGKDFDAELARAQGYVCDEEAETSNPARRAVLGEQP